jgi:hypothetical protein
MDGFAQHHQLMGCSNAVPDSYLLTLMFHVE